MALVHSKCSFRDWPTVIISLPVSIPQGLGDCALGRLFYCHGRCVRGGPQQDVVLSCVDASAATDQAGAAVLSEKGVAGCPQVSSHCANIPRASPQPWGCLHSQDGTCLEHVGVLGLTGFPFWLRRLTLLLRVPPGVGFLQPSVALDWLCDPNPVA